MKTYTTTTGQEFTINYVNDSPAGYGHKKITVQVVDENGNARDFTHTTDNMPGYDAANDLEGQERYEGLFELIETQLDDPISEWISETDKKQMLIDWMVDFYDDCGRFTYFTDSLSESPQTEEEFRKTLNEKSLSDLIMTVYDNDESGQKFIEDNNL